MYFKTNGIHHRVIYLHTHEQNSMAECRHRYIVETELNLLGQCNAPLKYWSYAFESSVYLINHMPTSVLNHETPFECHLKLTPDYAFLRTSGCLYFSFLCPYNAHKLDFCFSACVFLGYNNFHLGYRCLDLSSKCIYLTRHVWFHENVFPLDKSE
jgi:histone deacetylase 1/2